jgi:hypothetical protein
MQVDIVTNSVPCTRRLGMASRNRHGGEWRNPADFCRTGRKFRSRNNGFVTLRASRAAFHASTRKGIAVWVWDREAICERLQEDHDLVLLVIRQAQGAGGHVKVVLDLGPGPACNPLDSSGRAVSGSYLAQSNPGHIACVVEVHKLLQALDVAIMEELLLEVRPGRLGGRTL